MQIVHLICCEKRCRAWNGLRCCRRPESGLAWSLALDRIKRAIKWLWKIISMVSLRHFRIEINASGFDYILAPPSRVLVSQQRPSFSGLIPWPKGTEWMKWTHHNSPLDGFIFLSFFLSSSGSLGKGFISRGRLDSLKKGFSWLHECYGSRYKCHECIIPM
jgi:hypothetical protein